MTPVLEVSGGGAFLVRPLSPDNLFTPEDLNDELPSSENRVRT